MASACAITDHGKCSGRAVPRPGAQARVKPILGCEMYVRGQPLRQGRRIDDYEAAEHHLILLAMNRDGYRNSAGW